MVSRRLQINLCHKPILHKPIIRKFDQLINYASFKDNIWRADLADMQLISKYNKGIRYLLCAMDLFSKYAWVIPLKDKKGITIVNAFQSILDRSKRKPSPNSPSKIWFKENHIEIYSTYNEGKSAVAERFIRTLKNKIYKHLTAVSKIVFFDVLNDIAYK